jgi:hypothetical protein
MELELGLRGGRDVRKIAFHVDGSGRDGGDPSKHLGF